MRKKIHGKRERERDREREIVLESKQIKWETSRQNIKIYGHIKSNRDRKQACTPANQESKEQKEYKRILKLLFVVVVFFYYKLIK